MTIRGSVLNFLHPGKYLVPSIPVTFVTYAPPVLAFFPFFCHAYPMAISFSAEFDSPSLGPGKGKMSSIYNVRPQRTQGWLKLNRG